MTPCGRASHFSSHSRYQPSSPISQACRGTSSSHRCSLHTLNLELSQGRWKITTSISGEEDQDSTSVCPSACPVLTEESHAVGGTKLVFVISSAPTASAHWEDFFLEKSDKD